MRQEEIIREELERLREEIIDASREAGQQASGNTYAQIAAAEVTGGGGKLVGPRYVGVLARGRREGKAPRDFARIIREWAVSKGISFASEEEFDRWAKAVAWKIRREGTALWREKGRLGGRTDVFDGPVERFIGRVARRLADLYTVEITKTIDDIWR